MQQTGEKDRGRELNSEDLKEAARLRFMVGMKWERIADRLNCDPATLWRWRNRGDAWDKAKAEVLEEMKHQADTTAWGALIRAAQNGDVSAAKELLNRTEGAVTQKQELTGAGGGPMQIATPESLALMDEREAVDHGDGN